MTSPAYPPKAVLFDVGNVIVRWDPRTLYAKIILDDAERAAFLSEVATMAWHTEHDRGKPFEQGVAELSALHPRHAPAIRAWWDRWDEMFSGPIPETEAVMRDLAARGVAMHGLTNMSPQAWPGVQAMSPVFALLDEVVVSGAEGLVKPDPAIYALVLARTGLAAHDLFFIDDARANIEAADALGFHTHHFVDPAAVRPALEAVALL